MVFRIIIVALLLTGSSIAEELSDRNAKLRSSINHIPHKSGSKYLKEGRAERRQRDTTNKNYAACYNSMNCVVVEVGDGYYFNWF